MSLNSDFTGNPADFLSNKVIVVPASTDAACKQPGVYKFTICKDSQNLYTLEPVLNQNDDFITAYYLPWEMYKATTMDLGSEADFFFTSEMTNCRFTVFDKNPKTPKVAHVSGAVKNGNASRARNQMESDAMLDPKSGRRLSIAQYKKHQYCGQNFDGSSAFVFGQRNGDGEWKFSAQITKGVLAAVSKITEDLNILNYVAI